MVNQRLPKLYSSIADVVSIALKYTVLMIGSTSFIRDDDWLRAIAPLKRVYGSGAKLKRV